MSLTDMSWEASRATTWLIVGFVTVASYVSMKGIGDHIRAADIRPGI